MRRECNVHGELRAVVAAGGPVAKVSKRAVDYRKASVYMRAVGKTCGSCSMYVTGGRCTLVAGAIVRSDVCDRWAAKGLEAQRA